MIRGASSSDMPLLFAIRDSARENPLSDPAAVTERDTARLIEQGACWVWQQKDGTIAGFSAADLRAGTVVALLVAPGHEGRGIGRALLGTACAALRAAGHRDATLRAEAGSRAERHYRAAGWIDAGTNGRGGLILRKPL